MSDKLMSLWEDQGFAAPPEVFVAGGKEIILRAYSESPGSHGPYHGTSRLLGNCFFVPACGRQEGPIGGFTVNRRGWTGRFLEQHLNAFVFGNTYERLALFRIEPGIEYSIGAIGQDTRYRAHALSNTFTVVQRHLPWPGQSPSYFRQIVLRVPLGKTLKEVVTLLGTMAVIMPLTRVAHA